MATKNETTKTRRPGLSAEDRNELAKLGINVSTPGRKSLADGGTDKRRTAAMEVFGKSLGKAKFPCAVVSAEMPAADVSAVIPAKFPTVKVPGYGPDAVKRWAKVWAEENGRQINNVRGVNILR